MLESPAEAAANEMVVNLYRVFRQAGEVGDTILCPRRHLGADPDVAGVFRVMHRAVHRLHRGVGKERQLVNGVKPLRRAGERLLGVAFIARHDAGPHRCLFELTDDAGAVDTRIRTVIPLNRSGLEAFLGSPQMVRDYGYCLIDRDDLTHAFDRTRGRLVHRPCLSAAHRGDGNSRHLQSRQPHVDAEFRPAIDLVRRIETLRGSTDQSELLRPLQDHGVGRRYGQRSSDIHQITVGQATRARGMHDGAVLCPTGVAVDSPLLGGRLNQQRARGGARLTQRHPESAN